jgi:antitoxin component of MazEF toxin-antitoxin module
MRKRLTRQGNSAAVVIDRPILEILGLEAGGTVEMLTNGNSLLIRPVRPLSTERREAFARALAETNEMWGDMLRRLAKR